jgi:polyribonucleotide nucleotidyltransferase
LADYRVEFVEDVINEGDIVKVKVIGFDKKGRPKLSYRSVDQATGEDISDRIVAKNADNEDEYEDRYDNRRGDGRNRDRRDGNRDNYRDNNNRRDSRNGDRDGHKKRKGFFS